MAKSDSNDDKAPIIIIKKVKKVAGGHHGGAWKVAYADFVTAMMAFFLLLWLLNVTTDEQRHGIADYFAPNVVSSSTSGAGGVLGGKTISEEGAMTENSSSSAIDSGEADLEEGRKKKSDAELDREDEASFKATEDELKEALKNNPALMGLSENLMVDMTPEGLRIQIVDKEGKPMFELGKANPLPQTIKLLEVITEVIKDIPNKISLRGHTDSKPYGKGAEYTNWELSTDRANASRRVMIRARLESSRLANVQGLADREHLDTEDPNSARNRRITILLIKQSIVKADKKAMENFKNKKAAEPKKDEPKKREKGVIYFP